jgi:hypothetical protein
MRKSVRILLLGIAVWGLPFALGMALFPVMDVESALFDSVMSVAMAFSAILFSYIHLSRCAQPSLDEGLLAGTIWMAMSVALDAPFFLFGPGEMRMDPIDYMDDIAVTYFMIPIIAAGMGRALRRG